MHYFIFENKNMLWKIVGHKGFWKVACLAQQGTRGLGLRRSLPQLPRTAPPRTLLQSYESALIT